MSWKPASTGGWRSILLEISTCTRLIDSSKTSWRSKSSQKRQLSRLPIKRKCLNWSRAEAGVSNRRKLSPRPLLTSSCRISRKSTMIHKLSSLRYREALKTRRSLLGGGSKGRRETRKLLRLLPMRARTRARLRCAKSFKFKSYGVPSCVRKWTMR